MWYNNKVSEKASPPNRAWNGIAFSILLQTRDYRRQSVSQSAAERWHLELELTRRKYTRISHTHSQTHWSRASAPPGQSLLSSAPLPFSRTICEKQHVFPGIRKQRATARHCKNWKRCQKGANGTIHTGWLQANCAHLHSQIHTRTSEKRTAYRTTHTSKEPVRLRRVFLCRKVFPFGSAYQIGLVANGGVLVGFILPSSFCSGAELASFSSVARPNRTRIVEMILSHHHSPVTLALPCRERSLKTMKLDSFFVELMNA